MSVFRNKKNIKSEDDIVCIPQEIIDIEYEEIQEYKETLYVVYNEQGPITCFKSEISVKKFVNSKNNSKKTKKEYKYKKTTLG